MSNLNWCVHLLFQIFKVIKSKFLSKKVFRVHYMSQTISDQISKCDAFKTEVNWDGVRISLYSMPDSSWMIHEVTFIQSYCVGIFFDLWFVEFKRSEVLDDLCFILKWWWVMEMRSVSSKWVRHSTLFQLPCFGSFELNSEILLKVHVNRSIVAFPSNENLNLTSRSVLRVISSKVHSKLTSKSFDKHFPKLNRRSKIQTSSLLKCLNRIFRVHINTINLCSFLLLRDPNMNLLTRGCSD